MSDRRRRSAQPKEPHELEPSEYRVPPHDLQAEAAVLSAVLSDPRNALPVVAAVLRPTSFYSESHRRIFEAIQGLESEGKPIDVVQVQAWLRDRDRLAQVGGPPYLSTISTFAPVTANFEGYARIVADKARARALILACQRVVAEGYAGFEDVGEYVERSERAIYELAREGGGRSRGERMSDVVARSYQKMAKAYERPGELLGIPSGFADLDAQTGGMHPGEQTIVAARPGMGKTSLMLNAAGHVSSLGYGVIVFSLEMPVEQLAMRAICGEAGVPIQRARTNRFDDRDWSAMATAANALSQTRHLYLEGRSMGMAEIRSIVRTRSAEMARDGVRLALVAIDYVQIIEDPPGVDGERAVAMNARNGKRLAKETGAHVMLLSQLNRAVELRQNKRPMLADLRESGALEEAADVAVGIYRESYYDASKGKGRAELIVLKQRNGPVGCVDVGFDGPTARFFDLPVGPVDGHAATCRCSDCTRGEAAE